jgi:hypothetical protein
MQRADFKMMHCHNLAALDEFMRHPIRDAGPAGP